MVAEIASEYTAAWGGMRRCESPPDCFVNQYGELLSPVSATCTMFITEEVVGSFCTCSFIQANQGPKCDEPSVVTIEKLVILIALVLFDVVGITVILYKFNLIRRSGKLSMNVSSIVGLLGFVTLVIETGNSFLSVLGLFNISSEASYTYIKFTPTVLMTLPGSALLLCVVVWKKMLKKRTSKAAKFSLEDKVLCSITSGFAALQLGLRLGGLYDEATLAAAFLFGFASIAYPLTGYQLLSTLKSPTTSKAANSTEKDRFSNLRWLLIKVTAVCVCQTASLLAFWKITEWGPSNSLAPSIVRALPLLSIKLCFTVVSYILASFTLDTLIAKWAISRRSSSKVGPTPTSKFVTTTAASSGMESEPNAEEKCCRRSPTKINQVHVIKQSTLPVVQL